MDDLTSETGPAYAAAVALGRRHQFDEAHSVQVARLALSLFDQLRDRHELSDVDRRVLTAAAVLHDIGISISFQGHHKHSLDMISASRLPGFSPRDMRLVATVARYHRKSEPTTRHSHFAELTIDEQHRVEKMAALLRLADALDRSHGQLVTQIHATVEKRTLRLELVARGDLPLELWALQKKTPLFTKVFHLDVSASRRQEGR